MSLLSNFLWFLIIYFPIFWAIKLAYILSPQNSLAELKCWTLQFLDSQFICYDNYFFRPMLKECTANLKNKFPQGSSWDLPDDLKVVELTPSTLKEYFTSNKNALNTPFIVRGFLNQPDTDFDLNKYADVHYILENLQSNNTYIFDIIGKTPQTMTMKSALEGMIAGDGIYMKFNREFPKDEQVFGTAIDRATDVLRAQGGPTVVDALTDSIKVTFLTYGDTMNTPIHNAMPANWFYQIAGKKEWKLYNPKHSIYLEPRNFPNNIASHSDYDTAFKGGPRYLKVASNPGDFLFFPSFWLHEVTNVGPGLKLAIGLRPSRKAILGMWMTALFPFYENPADTTGLALCHIGPSFKIVLDTAIKLIKLRVNALLTSSAPAATSLLDADTHRARVWWSEKHVNQSLKSRNAEEDVETTDGRSGSEVST